MNPMILLAFVLFVFPISAKAECVYGAKNKTGMTLLDRHTLLLHGGPGRDIIVKTDCFIYRASSIIVLRDSFCSWESAVLYVDEEVCDAKQVTKVD